MALLDVKRFDGDKVDVSRAVMTLWWARILLVVLVWENEKVSYIYNYKRTTAGPSARVQARGSSYKALVSSG